MGSRNGNAAFKNVHYSFYSHVCSNVYSFNALVSLNPFIPFHPSTHPRPIIYQTTHQHVQTDRTNNPSKHIINPPVYLILCICLRMGTPSCSSVFSSRTLCFVHASQTGTSGEQGPYGNLSFTAFDCRQIHTYPFTFLPSHPQTNLSTYP